MKIRLLFKKNLTILKLFIRKAKLNHLIMIQIIVKLLRRKVEENQIMGIVLILLVM